MTWTAFYQNKIAQRPRSKSRCEWCGHKGSTSSHHLFRRRPDHASLQEDWNIIQICVPCHHAETYEMQVGLALKRMHKYGPDHIEERLRSLPTKVDHGLPDHFIDALEEYKTCTDSYHGAAECSPQH